MLVYDEFIITGQGYDPEDEDFLTNLDERKLN
jgi:hypothetical protein